MTKYGLNPASWFSTVLSLVLLLTFAASSLVVAQPQPQVIFWDLQVLAVSAVCYSKSLELAIARAKLATGRDVHGALRAIRAHAAADAYDKFETIKPFFATHSAVQFVFAIEGGVRSARVAAAKQEAHAQRAARQLTGRELTNSLRGIIANCTSATVKKTAIANTLIDNVVTSVMASERVACVAWAVSFAATASQQLGTGEGRFASAFDVKTDCANWCLDSSSRKLVAPEAIDPTNPKPTTLFASSAIELVDKFKSANRTLLTVDNAVQKRAAATAATMRGSASAQLAVDTEERRATRPIPIETEAEFEEEVVAVGQVQAQQVQVRFLLSFSSRFLIFLSVPRSSLMHAACCSSLRRRRMRWR
jgi:hypothetical protein